LRRRARQCGQPRAGGGHSRADRAEAGEPARPRRPHQGDARELGRPAAAITLADIIEAVDGPIALTGCLDANGSDCCALEQPCDIRPHWIGVNALVRDALAQVTLAHLIAAPQALPGAAVAPARELEALS
jgi:hypothetical protein